MKEEFRTPNIRLVEECGLFMVLCASLDRNWQAYPRLLCHDGPMWGPLISVPLHVCDVGDFICAVVVRIRENFRNGMFLGAGSSFLVMGHNAGA